MRPLPDAPASASPVPARFPTGQARPSRRTMMMADQVSRVLDRLGRPSGRFASLAIAAVLALWFALPAFSIAYCEGFQPEIVINTEALRLGDLSLGDTAYPFNGRFFLLTRLGTTISVLGSRDKVLRTT